MSKQTRTFSPEFKQQATCLVLDQGYSHVEASGPIGVGESLMRRWVQQPQIGATWRHATGQGTATGRFAVSRLMAELGLVCEQLGKHAYKQATVERIDIPNHLHREFTVEAPNPSGAATSPMFGRRGNGITWLWCWSCSLAERWAGHSRYDATPTLLYKRWK